MVVSEAGLVGGPRFSIGGVLSATFAIWFRNLLRFLVIMVAALVPAFGLSWLGGLIVSATGAVRGFSINVQADGWSGLVYALVVCLLFLAAFCLIQGAVTYGVLQNLRGERAGIGACIGQGIGALPRLFVAGLLFLIAVCVVVFGVGYTAFELVLPYGYGGLNFYTSGLVVMALFGLFALVLLFLLAVFCWVFVPAIVVERVGPIACFGRSMALTKGRRWAVFALIFLLGLANAAAGYLSDALRSLGLQTAGDLLDITFSALFIAFMIVQAAVGYSRLRAEKEGVGLDAVVGVFD